MPLLYFNYYILNRVTLWKSSTYYIFYYLSLVRLQSVLMLIKLPQLQYMEDSNLTRTSFLDVTWFFSSKFNRFVSLFDKIISYNFTSKQNCVQRNVIWKKCVVLFLASRNKCYFTSVSIYTHWIKIWHIFMIRWNDCKEMALLVRSFWYKNIWMII